MIFGVFDQTVVQYEEEIRRQRKLLEINWKPAKTEPDIRQQSVSEKVFSSNQFCKQEIQTELSSSINHPKQPESSKIKEEEEELGISRDGEQHEVKQEPEAIMVTVADGESDSEPDGDREVFISHESTAARKDFIRERLSAAAGEIFSVLEQAVHFEEETDSHRKQLDSESELLYHALCVSKDVLSKQNSSNQETNNHLDMETLEPSAIKVEQDDVYTSQVKEEPELKQESDVSMITPMKEESDFSQDSPVAGKQDQQGTEYLGSCSFTKTGLLSNTNENNSQSEIVDWPSREVIQDDNQIVKKTATCDICGKAFKYPSQVTIHMRTHKDEKPFSCDRCGKNFRSNGQLVLHIRTHTGEKPYHCEICENRYVSASKLKSHMQTHTGDRPYSCEECGKSYSKMTSLKVHARTHRGEKPYFCNTCGKGFNEPTWFKRHMAKHSEEQQS